MEEDTRSLAASDELVRVVAALKVYLLRIIPAIVSSEIIDNDALRSSIEMGDNSDTITKFSSSSDLSVLLIEDRVANDGDVAIRSDISRLFPSGGSGMTGHPCAAIVKIRDGPLDGQVPIANQVHLITLPGGEDGIRYLFLQIQQLNRHVYTPAVRVAGQQVQSSEAGAGTDESENITTLQKRLRELDAALEQCQRGTTIPQVVLPIPPILETAAKSSSSSAAPAHLKGFLEKYNAVQVDQLLKELGLADAMGNTSDHIEEFANEVNKFTRLWPAEIARQTRLVESPFSVSAEREIDFWKELERKLTETKAQLADSPAVLLTKLVLRRTNRVSEQLIREAETEIDKSLDIVQTSVSFLRDFPIDDLHSATDLMPKLNRAITHCMQHFSKLKHSRYDFTRALRLLEAVGNAIFTKIPTIIREKGILLCNIDVLRRVKKQADEVFANWEKQYIDQRSMLKDVAKRRKEPFSTLNLEQDIAVRRQQENEIFKQRLAAVVDFREQHEKLLNISSSVLSGQESEAMVGINEAYQLVVRNVVDVLDISPAGNSAWSSAHSLYEKRLERIEERITRLLEDRLGAAQTADDMFRVFSTFNPLFFRPAIRNAVNSFRASLVKNVREDVRRLQDKFRLRYDESLERATADLRDIPPLSGRIIWARQIENQLTTLMKRMEDVLGVGWEDHFEGKQLKEVCDELRNYLDTDQLYKEWLSQQLKADNKKYAQVKDFLMFVDVDPRTNKRVLRVSFDERQVVVFKEVRYLEWLLPGMATAHKTIPTTIASMAKEAYQRYPTAMALQAALSGFSQAKSGINEGNTILLTAHVQAVRDLIKAAFGGSKKSKRWIKWDSPELDDWVGQFSNKVYALQERVDDVKEKISAVNELLKQLRRATYNRGAFAEIIAGVQAVVDEMQIRGFANVPAWVASLDTRIEGILQQRLRNAVKSWVKAFTSDSGKFEAEDRSAADEDAAATTKAIAVLKLGRGRAHSTRDKDKEKEVKDISGAAIESLTLTSTVHEILLSNQILFVAPTFEQARIDWINEFHQYISTVCTLSRISSSRFNVFADAADGPKDYSSVLLQLEPQSLREPFVIMEDKLAAARGYAQQWLQYQALWDASSTVLADKVGRDIGKWQTLLHEIKQARTTIDTTTEEQRFGPIVVNHKQVQNKVNMKYDTWQKESQTRFGAILLEEIKSAQAELVACKAKLEAIFLEGPTKEVIVGVEFILKTKSGLNAKKKLVSDLESSEKLLQKQRFQFPREWMSVSNVLGAFADLCQILDRRIMAMDLQLPTLQLKIRDEDAANASRTEELLASWEKQRPVQGGLNPSEVIQTLSMFSAQVTKLTEDALRVRGAKEALGLEFIVDDRLSFISREISDLRDAWQCAIPLYEKLHAARLTPLKDVSPTKVRKQLEEQLEELRALPAKVRTYAAIEYAQETLSQRQTVQPVLRDLCTEALKERHWKLLLSAMGISKSATDLILGDIWECNPLAHRKVIQEVLSTAQGELALEQFLRDLREHWMGCELNLVLRDGVRLVTGWDVLFSSLEDNLNSLASLKQSPYFRNVPEFQEDTQNWETRLTHLRGIFDVWVEVQRKWVYLRGIFRNPDIKAQLPAQHSKFKSVDNEFLSLMKRVAQKPLAVDLLQIDNLARQLERQDATMTLVQKALGEYLERQRQIFPRFYFVNNDDLVEIIGNSNEPAKVVTHLGKMFAALNTVEMSSPSSSATGGSIQDVVTDGGDGSSASLAGLTATAMCSKEGETVLFSQPVVITVSVKEWLIQLESAMATTIASLLEIAIVETPSDNDTEALLTWISKFPAQVIILSSQLAWSSTTEIALGKQSSGKGQGGGDNDKPSDALIAVTQALEGRLHALSESVLHDLDPSLRKKCEQLLTEMVHQRDVARLLVANKVVGKDDFNWLYHLRFYWASNEADLMQRLNIRMSNASFFYGFEYLGIGERLVQTPLTDRCYLTLTQALHFRMGANPFGPAGTGKTETVKMLGSQLGRFVLVFNCDTSFDYAAMGRIFAGLCQVGAWGCFDEFNRLEERILSAVSQQILTIQRGLLLHQEQIELLGNPCKLRQDVGIFVTLNPGYAGRSNLPDNLKQLFRAVAMVVPDRKMIAQVMLFSQGIVTAEELAGKIVLLFTLCEEQLSSQSHYDFGLRALKSVLIGAGELKRVALASIGKKSSSEIDNMNQIEMEVLIKATCDSVVPKLVAEDIPLFISLLQAVFPGSELPQANETQLLTAVRAVCEEDSLEVTEEWGQKVLQLKQVLDMRHGVMMVGPSGTGKTTAWRTLLKALGRVDGIKGDFYVIDPKSVKKEKLFGFLDPNTLEWSDGIFTKILRRVIEGGSIRGGTRRSWIVFDGDVDPEWAENLNSVLDDNKVLTLPTGDRLKLPNNVRIMMEVDSLKHATMATVSRCGMVWFAEGTVSLDVTLRHLLRSLRKEDVQSLEGASSFGNRGSELQKKTLEQFVDTITPHFTSAPGLVGVALEYALQQPHVMEPTIGRFITTLYSLLVRGVAVAVEHNDNNSDFPMSESHMERFALKWLLHSLLWSFGGSMSSEKRAALGDMLLDHTAHVDHLPGSKTRLFDVYINPSDGGWVEWSSSVPRMEIESHKVTSSDVVITTTDTVRHIEVIKAWLNSHKPLILCGPPGSGKTMTLTSVLEAMPEFILASLNFSSTTTPDLILKTFAQYCEVVDSPDGLLLQPNRQSYRESQWLVIFCDEINLPEVDTYGTQRVIMFMRQLTEQGGYWNNECKWVSLRRIQFVGACNPPTDAGRVPLSSRFLRHAPLLLVDYPVETSLKQIYRCFNHALLKLHPNLRGAVDSLNNAMVDFYLRNQQRFTADVAPQYIYSPRELSRWVRAMYEAMEPLEAMTLEELVRLWAHEALRLFHDRLITSEERDWCDCAIDEVAALHFPGVDIEKALERPMLYSNWLTKTYQSTPRDQLREFVAARLKVFYEEELDVPLVIFDDVLEHVLRIDNVLRHPMGHLLLVGESGVGKTVLSRFVSWMNGLTVFQIKASNRYTIEQFDEDLRGLLRRVGVEGEKICFIFDESNVLSSAFLERMNALLASGEVPGLFEGDERLQLMSACRDSYSQRDGLMMDSEDELWRRFTKMVQRNLHVVFTMNPASSDFANRCTASPALFNRCVVDWFGTWTDGALAQVGFEFTAQLDTGFTDYKSPLDITSLGKKKVNKRMSLSFATAGSQSPIEVLEMVTTVVKSSTSSLREAVVTALVCIHKSVKQLTLKLGKATGRQHYLSPRDFLDVIHKFTATEHEKRSFLEEQQTHIRTGLQKLLETQDQVAELRHEMVQKEEVLKQKDGEANEKLTQMVTKQNEAEQRKKLAEELSTELQRQNEEIRVRRETVEGELSLAEPALLSAKHSVQNIRKAQLDEVRALVRPPNPVRLTMEMVCLMIGEKNADWNDIRRVIRGDEFIAIVVNFDPLTLTQKQIKAVQEDFLSNPELNYDSVDRASKACGPLYKWAESQVQYATILRRVKPLRDEVNALLEKSEALEQQQQEVVAEVGDLEAAIIQFKAEYAAAIRDTETIRSERDIVGKKVGRAEALLLSLEQEKDRWQLTSAAFDKQMSTLIGDSLIAAAFLTYAGIFDHKARRNLFVEWSETLEILGVPFRSDLEIIPYLSKPSDQVYWRGCGLPSEDLSMQNAILLERFNRYPLIIDPSGQATNFILNRYAAQKITQTSFLDASFLKTLASAIRFGSPLLVQDVEQVDPILNPLLNRELQKTGGRTLIRLGSEDIDFSPKFLIILITRNPSTHFAPDLCSRVTMVNFTITPASLESQALSAILKSERPDVDTRRTELLKLQGAQSAKLRELEEALLNKISAVQGAILDDDTVIKTLETIQSEAADLSREVAKTQEVIEEVRLISSIYEPLAVAMTAVYFSLEKLSDISFLYQFSLGFFLETLERVLSTVSRSNPGGSGALVPAPSAVTLSASASKARLQTLSDTFFAEISRRVLRGLKFDDKLMFTVRLCQIATHGNHEKGLDDTEADLLFRGSAISTLDASPATLAKLKDVVTGHSLDESATRQLLSLTLLPVFSGLPVAMAAESSQWVTFFQHAEPEKAVPLGWISGELSVERTALLKVIIVRAFRPERTINALEAYVTAVFGEKFAWRDYSRLDLKQIIENDSKFSAPIMICSEAGQDASAKVDSLAAAMDKSILQVAMGSSEGYTEADRSIAQAAKAGSWVLLRNVHLCPEWLANLEKRLHGFGAHDSFRLFLTCEISPKLPPALLRASEVLVAEATTGIKASLQRFFGSIPSARTDKQPSERCRLYGLLAWFNAVVQERLRYAPLGWTKRYEFSETDAACALDVIDEWVDKVAGPRAHVSPEELPWQALRTLLSQSLYGGRISHPFDQAILDSFIDSIFTPANYASGASVVKDYQGAAVVKLPDSFSRQAFDAWIQSLPDEHSPAWLGMPVTAESQLKSSIGNRILTKLAVLQGVEDLDEKSGGGRDLRAHQLKMTSDLVQRWLATLPVIDVTSGIVEASATSLQRSLSREVARGKAAILLVRQDLQLLKTYCDGGCKVTNALRQLLGWVATGIVPAHWREEYVCSAEINLATWIADLVARARALSRYKTLLSTSSSSPSAVSSVQFWVGGMFSPESFITATRQFSAQANKWSLEELELYLDIGCGQVEGVQDTIIEGLQLEGAQWAADSLQLTDEVRSPLPPSRLRWRLRADRPAGHFASFPIYLNSSRTDLVVEVLLRTPLGIPATVWAQRGVGFIMQSVV